MIDQVKQAPTLEAIRKKRADILRIAAAYGVTNVRVFGSVARGDARPESDIDFLVEYPPHFSLLDLSGIVRELQELLGHKVELASGSHLREELRPYIMQDVVAL
jgi:hypothetical protein